MNARRLLAVILLGHIAHTGGLARAREPVPSMRLALVARQVADLDASIRWYSTHLDFKQKERREFPQLRLAILGRADFELELVENPRTLRGSTVLVGAVTEITGFAKIAFQVGDVVALYRRLEAQGASFALRLRDSNQRPGQQYFVVLDNEGNWLQFMGQK